MARNRSTILIALGAGMFAVAAAIAFLALGGDDDGDSSDPPEVTVAPAAQESEGTQTTTPAIRIPDGKEAVSVSIPAVPGMAGHVKTGDRVNIFGTFKDRQPNAPTRGIPIAKLILSNVQVLAATNAGGNVTYVLAVNADEAERVIYLASFEGIWLTLVRDGAPAVGGTPGRTAANAA